MPKLHHVLHRPVVAFNLALGLWVSGAHRVWGLFRSPRYSRIDLDEYVGPSSLSSRGRSLTLDLLDALDRERLIERLGPSPAPIVGLSFQAMM